MQGELFQKKLLTAESCGIIRITYYRDSQDTNWYQKHYIIFTMSLKRLNNLKSETYRQRLLTEYPESEFSKILSDPDYYSKKIAEMKRAERLYQDAYDIYVQENFRESIAMCDSALTESSRG